jgi:hypothetical protein
LSGLLFDHPPSLHAVFLGILFFYFFPSASLSFSIFSFFLDFVSNSANNKLHIAQGQKGYKVEVWEDEKGMETILPPKIN